MRKLVMFCTLLTIVFGVQVRSNVGENESGNAFSGMFFSSEYVTKCYQSSGIFCVQYEDADAGMFAAKIVVDSVAYKSVKNSIISSDEIVGTLVLNQDLSSDGIEVFSIEME